jgi:xanthine dehydrogenase accessory factor
MNEESRSNFSLQITERIARVLREGRTAILLTLVDAPGAFAPHVARKLLIEENGTLTGTLGDPNLDLQASAHAAVFRQMRAEARTVRVEEFASQLEEWTRARVLFERIEPEPHVVICGAGHVGAALARLAHATGYRVTLIDDRASFVERERFPETEIELVAAKNWEPAINEAVGRGRNVSVAVVTRGHNEDEECMRAVLRARPDYVGMIGSKRRTNIVLARLREDGFDEAQLNEVCAPIGLNIGSVSPEEVALSILAEIVASRRGGSGEPLSAWRRQKKNLKSQN